MKTFIQNGEVLTVPAPAGGCVSGLLYKVGNIIGVAQTTVDAGADVALCVTGVFELLKTSAQAWAVGDPLYMIPATRLLTNAAGTGNFLCGVATEVALNPSASGRIRLNGVSAPAAT